MNRAPKIIVLSLLLAIGATGLTYVAIMAYIHHDVFGKSPSYEETRQNFIKNESYFQKAADCFLEIANYCLSDSTQGTLLFSIQESGDEFLFRLFFSTENETELVFPIRNSDIEISQDQKKILESRGIDYKMVQTLYSNLKKTSCRAITKCEGNPDVLFYMTFKILDYCAIDYLFYPHSIDEDSIRPISNSPLGQRVAISVK
ncbi:MAG: hypothetical protein IKU03_05095 [Bacteroidales bacterium]|nr:hypothetical protein [Bacteroidales bacterium]